MKEKVFKVFLVLLDFFLLLCYSICTIGIIGVVSIGNMWMIAKWGNFWYYTGVITVFVMFVGEVIYMHTQKHKNNIAKEESDATFADAFDKLTAKEAELDDLNKEVDIIGKNIEQGGSVTLGKDRMDKETK